MSVSCLENRLDPILIAGLTQRPDKGLKLKEFWLPDLGSNQGPTD